VEKPIHMIQNKGSVIIFFLGREVHQALPYCLVYATLSQNMSTCTNSQVVSAGELIICQSQESEIQQFRQSI